jgi:fructoselysine-6-P-deglycase FrlB-like protein
MSTSLSLSELIEYTDWERGKWHMVGAVVQAGKSFLGIAANCAAELASGSYTQACFVGSGPLMAVARESALKLLEMTAGSIQTMSESALGLRHGPMAGLNDETLFVCFLSGDERIRKYETDLLEEIGKAASQDADRGRYDLEFRVELFSRTLS